MVRAGGQRAEHPFGDLRALLAEVVEDLVRVGVERAAQALDRDVVFDGQVDARAGGAVVRPLPHAVERVLQQRQLVRPPHQPVELVAAVLIVPRREIGEVVEQPVDQRRLDIDVADLGRPADRLAAILAGHARRQEHAGVDGVGQAFDQRAGAEILGAHRDRHVDAGVRLARAFKQQRDEGFGLFAAVIVLVAEQLLELVDQQQQVGALAQMPRAAPFDHRARPAREIGPQHVDVLRRDVGILFDALGFEQPAREILQRRAAGPEVDDLPARAGLGHEAELERVEQAGADQRRLAGARRAQHGEEAGRRQPVDHRVGAVLAAEEQVGFLAPEGAQAGIGRTLQQVVGHRRSSATIFSTLSAVSPSWQSILANPPDMAISGFGAGGANRMVFTRGGSPRWRSILL